MQVTFSAANMWVTVFIVIMQVGVAVAIMQVVNNNFVNSAMLITMNHVITIVIMQVTVSVIFNFIFLSLTPTFHKIDWKTFKGNISGLHFTAFVNILQKSRYFAGRNYTQIS